MEREEAEGECCGEEYNRHHIGVCESMGCLAAGREEGFKAGFHGVRGEG